MVEIKSVDCVAVEESGMEEVHEVERLGSEETEKDNSEMKGTEEEDSIIALFFSILFYVFDISLF